MSHRNFSAAAAVLGALVCAQVCSAVQPLALSPENPHYFVFRDKPFLFVTSGEHYGAVLNQDFDYAKYLDALAADGLNGTRTWSGCYCEPASAFNISDNTLAPAPGKYITPWPRSDKPGYANGGNKFDLTQWNPAYFARLKDFMTRASDRGIIVEMNLFCPFYEESMWKLSPMNAINNVNGIGEIDRTNVYTLDKSAGLLAVQEQMVRKIVRELKDFDNLYYEICNEPYFGGVTMEWQHHIADIIVQEEQALGVKHLISQNIANDKAKVVKPHPAVSIFNFHYASPPETVPMNYALNKVIGENETGFKGTNGNYYRMEAWDFIIVGGGLYNNLDYSFTVGHENGTYVFPANQPGCGSPEFRRQISYLGKFVRRFDFIHSRPNNDVLAGNLPAGVIARALVKDGSEYCIYIRTALSEQPAGRQPVSYPPKAIQMTVKLPAGNYHAEWLNTKTGKIVQTEELQLALSDGWKLSTPPFEDDIALGIWKTR